MRILIENYRGWEIKFDTESENFYTVSSEHDIEQTKKSYASAKKYIDEYTKKNRNFKPIRVQKMATMYDNAEEITLIGLNEHNAFIYEDSKGDKKQLLRFEEKAFILVNPKNDNIFKELDLLYKEAKSISEKIKYATEKVIKVDAEQIKKNILGR